MNLHLTRDEWDRIAAEGGGVLFREGVEQAFPSDRIKYGAWGPPAEFVEAAKPCETCDGIGVSAYYPYPDCPDCLDGKRSIAVTVDRDGLIGTRWQINDTGGIFTVATVAGQYAYVKNERGTERRILAARIRPSKAKTGYTRLDDGLVTVGHVIVEWGPLVVVDPMAQNPSLRHTAWVEVYGNQDKIGLQALVFLTPPPSKSIDITAAIPSDVDPQSLVGQYALGVKVVS